MRDVYNIHVAVILGFFLFYALFVLPGFTERMNHFTWWGLITGLIFALTLILDFVFGTRIHTYIGLTVFFVELAIQGGVLYMSLEKCDLLQEAYHDVGPAMYYVGNHIMHFMLSMWAFVSQPPVSLQDPHLAFQTINAISLVCFYFTWEHVRDVYGCDMKHNVGMVLMVLIIVVCACTYEYLAQKASSSYSYLTSYLLRRSHKQQSNMAFQW